MPDLETAIKKLEELESKASGAVWHRFLDTEDVRVCHVDPHNDDQCDECLVLVGNKANEDADFLVLLRNTHPAMLALLRAMKVEILKHRSDWDGTHGMLPPWWLATESAERDFIAAVGGGE